MRRDGSMIVIALVLAASVASGLSLWIDPALAFGLALALLVLALD